MNLHLMKTGFFVCITVTMASCYQEEVVMYSQDELNAKIDSTVKHFDSTLSDEFYRSFELRKSIEVRQRVEKLLEDNKNLKNTVEKNVFSDTVRLSDSK